MLTTSFNATAADFQPGGRFGADPAAAAGLLQQVLGGALLAGFLSALFSIVWAAAVVITTDLAERGTAQCRLRHIFGRAVSRSLVILLSSILYFLGLAVLTIAASVLVVITGFGLVGGVIALVGLLFWWLKPSTRRPWLKWLIILTTPFGWPTYISIRWSMYLAAIALEDRGPANALSRSAQVTAGQWFRVAAILTVAPLIVGVLISVISTLVNLPLGINAASRQQTGLDPTVASISVAVSIILQILFQSVAIIAYTVLFNDLRNRREGTDISERLGQLEASFLTANG
ncbi:MAG TPA: glycerophosphoryl diester phosphodiesterase membrane domain-containing protein [Chloroflexota bacterium]|nr:glycerophosphoryl diester phosphodiesterase membrane domain-containing protein [Chloroflexota bacterium]